MADPALGQRTDNVSSTSEPYFSAQMCVSSSPSREASGGRGSWDARGPGGPPLLTPTEGDKVTEALGQKLL